jgi:hypothetical protein
MTQKEAYSIIRALGLTIRKDEYGEYRVAFKVPDSEPSAHYIDDLEDAVGTARAMAEFNGFRAFRNFAR